MTREKAFERGGGVLCHISSLPGKYGIGSMGAEARAFADALAESGVKYWQILPLVQTGYGDSPYQSVCSASGNPYLIDLDTLAGDGLLTEEDLKAAEEPAGDIDYGRLYGKRFGTLRAAFSRFDRGSAGFRAFADGGLFSDYALFMAMKEKYGCAFDGFPEKLRDRDGKAVERFSAENADETEFWLFVQYEFSLQWKALKAYVNGRGIKVIGDMPLYVAYDSCDVWANRSLFMLDERCRPTAVAGVPPDYFSEDGQLWGNPLYDWDEMRRTGFAWWTDRIARAEELYDIVRIDHFRGLDRYYAVPYGEETARVGEWLEAPGYEMLSAAEDRLGPLRVIAEDLGARDEGVERLLDRTGFPGMKVILFAFDGSPDNEYLPERIEENSVAYTGTHDNDTALGFLDGMGEEELAAFEKRVRASLRKTGVRLPVRGKRSCVEALCLLALASRSRVAVIPVQDWLCLDGSARMNEPSTTGKNWRFRLRGTPPAKARAYMRGMLSETSRL